MVVGLSFAAKGIIAIFLIVILVVGYERAPKIVQAAMETVDRNLEAVGINIIDIPKILSLTPRVGPDGSVAVTWKLNRDGRKIEDQYFKAVFSYKKYPDLIDNADNLIDDVCTVKHIDQKTAKPGWTCSVNNGKRTAVLQKEGCTGQDCFDKLAGLYKIDVSFEKKEGFTTRKGVMETDPLFGVYTTTYLENFDRDVKGCHTDCNVKECKRKILIGSLPPRVIPKRCADGVTDVYGRAYNLLYPPILGPVTIPEPTSCQYPPGNLPIVDDVKIGFKFEDAFRDCPGAELSKLYAKASHWIFFSNACSYGGDVFHAMEDETVGEVNNFLDKNGEAALSIVSDKTRFALSACVGKAELAFMYMGWKALGALAPHDAVQDQFAAEIRSYVQEELPPVIRDFTTPPGPDGKFYFSWKLPTGLNNVLENETTVNHQYGKRIGEYSSVETFKVLNNPDSGYVTSYVFYPKAHSISNVIGQHKFLIAVYAAKGTEFSTNKGDAGISGIYNRDYVEMYNGEVKGCKAGDFGAAHSKFVKKVTCNVIAEKIEVLKKGAPVTNQAYDEFKSKNPDTSCEFNKWGKCSDTDIAGIFSIFVNKNAGALGAPAILDCESSLPISGTYEKVCAAKDNLIATMQLLGWGCMGDGCPRPGVMA